MIKANEFAAQQEKETNPLTRIDALAEALGFHYEDGAYVRQAPARAERTTRVITPSPAVAKADKRRSHNFDWQRVRDLAVGATVDVTEEARKLRLNYATMSNRLSSWRWAEQNMYKRPAHYTIGREGHRIIIRRTA